MGEAFAIAQAEMAEENKRITALRDRLLAGFVDMEEVVLSRFSYFWLN
jgi:cysteine desulfurase